MSPLRILIAALVAAAQDPTPPTALIAGAPRAVALGAEDAALAEHGASKAFTFTVETPGTLIVSATSSDFDPWLRLETTTGQLINADDGRSDARTSCAYATLMEPTSVVIRVAAAAPEQYGTLALTLSITPETAATHDAIDSQKRVVEAADALLASGDRAGAIELAQAEAKRLLALPNADDSWCAMESLAGITGLLYRCEAFDVALESSTHSLAFRRRFVPRGDGLYRGALANQALLLSALGRPREALPFLRENAELCAHSLPRGDVQSWAAQIRLGHALRDLGEDEQARSVLRELVRECEETGKAGDRQLETSRAALAQTLMNLGDLPGARVLFERCIQGLERSHAADDMLDVTRADFGWLLEMQGDFVNARSLEETALAHASATRAVDDPEVQRERSLLALTLSDLGLGDKARELEEAAYAQLRDHVAPDNRQLQVTRMNLAVTRMNAGDNDDALALFQESLDALEGNVPEDDALLLSARRALAAGRMSTGDFAGARELLLDVVARRERTLPADHVVLEASRGSLMACCAELGLRDEALRIARELLDARCASLAASVLVLAPRELASRAEVNTDVLDLAFSFGDSCGWFDTTHAIDAELFTAVETMRGAELVGSRALRAAERDAQLAALRTRARNANLDVARLVNAGLREESAAAVRERDALQRELLASLAKGWAGALALPSPAEIARRLAPGEAAISYRCYLHSARGASKPATEMRVCAFVVRAGAKLARFELGRLDVLEAAVERWRKASLATEGVGGSERNQLGTALRKIALDPLQPALTGVTRAQVALDDALHTVPLDALPQGDGLVGDALEIHVRTSLWELAFDDARAPHAADFVAFGGIDYGRAEASSEAQSIRGAQDFAALPGTDEEVRDLARAFDARKLEGVKTRVMQTGDATRAALELLAPTARYLHLATHGYFAPDSIARDAVDQPVDAALGSGTFLRLDEQVRSLSPMLLCGIALAGANSPEDRLGHRAGVITAEELTGLDLSGCELAVLSACDTGAGVRRAGQGVASLQKSLHMAGARSVVTSLWKVSDSATIELMHGFYSRMWTDGDSPAQALWKSKQALRARRAPMRDWAGWILSGP